MDNKIQELINNLKKEAEEAKEGYEYFKEPDWPDKIEDRKQVIWFRNDVFHHAFDLGLYLGLMKAIESIKKMLDQEEKDDGFNGWYEDEIHEYLHGPH